MIQHPAVLNAVRDAIFVADANTGMILDANSAAEALCGRSLAELCLLHHTQLHPPDVETQARTGFKKDTEFPGLTEGLILHKDGRRVPVEIASSCFTAPDGRRMLVGVFRDLTERKEAEAKLHESEKRFRATFFQAAVGIAQTGIDSRWLLLNDRLCEIVGYSRDELLGKTFLEITHPDDLTASITAVRQLLSGEISSWETEKRYNRKDGSTIWGKLFLSLVRDEHNQPRYFIAILEDITQRIQGAQALRQAEQRLMLAQSAAHLGVWYRDWGTHVISVSGEYSRLHGLAPDRVTVTQEEWLSAIHPDDRERVEALRRESRERTHSFNAEYRVRCPDGSVHWLLAKGAVLLNDSGRPIGTTGVIMDITERKHAESALRESEERFRRVFEEGPLGVALVGKDYRFKKVNSALCQMVGYGEAELVKMSFVDITHPDDARANVELAERLFRREIPFYRMQKRYVKKSGEIIWINLTASMILGSDDEPLHGLAMVEDITEIKRTQEEALFRQKLESVGTLAGGIAHDFNNLLGAVQAQAELASAQFAAGSSPEEELKGIQDVATRGSEIVRQLMIYAGKESAVVGLVDVSQIVREMLQLLRVSVSKHAVLETNLGNDLPAVRANAAQLRQIVMNLITNASDAIGDRDGVICVITRRVTLLDESVAIPSSTLQDGDYVQLEVSDTGCGMSPETHARVFDPFFTTKSAGRGLGLAVVSGIVRSLGGEIGITSEPSKGTTFRVLLPSTQATAGPSNHVIPGVGEVPVPSQDGTVMVVEDEGLLRQAVVKMLRKNGFEVFEANDGSSAIDLLRSNGARIDAILLDMTIPGASCHEIVAEAANVTPDIRVILTSAYSQEAIADAMSSPQICSFIRKPFQLGVLVQTLQNVLRPGATSEVVRRDKF